MQPLLFWKDWEKNEKTIYLAFLGLFAISLFTLIYALITGSGNVIDYEILVQSEIAPVVFKTIELFPFQMDISADSILFNQWFGGTDIIVKPFISYLFLILLWVAYSLLMAISTKLNGFWYYFSSALLIVFFLTQRLEILELFGSNDKTGLIVALILFLPTSFFIQSFRKNLSLAKRLLIFGITTLIFGALIALFSEADRPFLYMATYGLPSPIIIGLIFILMVAHEIVAGLLNGVTSGNFGESNWKHFLVITIIYLINLGSMLLNKIGLLDVNIFPVNAVIFLIVSSILGVWGFSQRESQYNYLFSFKPYGGLLYIAMGLICFSTISYFYITGNDAITKSFEDIIIYSHISYGLIFLFYIMTNFLGPLLDGEKVGRILYKPMSMPYFSYRLAGLFTMLGIIFVQEWKKPVYNAVSAYYNAIGDIYKYEGDNISAIGYYKKGNLYSNENNRSNYAIANIYETQKETDKTLEYYSKSNLIRPSSFSYLNQANVYFNSDKFFETLFILEEASIGFPDNGPVANNLGLIYSRTEILDSSLFFLEKAFNIRKSKKPAKSNILAALTKSDFSFSNIDSITAIYKEDGYINKANMLAYLTSQGKVMEEELELEDSVMNQLSHAYIYNHLINRIFEDDTSAFEIGRKSIENSENRFFTRRLKLALGLNYYFKEEITKGLDQIKEIVLGDYYWAAEIYNLLGLLYMDKGDYTTAQDYFRKSTENFGRKSILNYAIASSFESDKNKAISAWDTLKILLPEYSDMANNVVKIIAVESHTEMKDKSDSEKYQWLVFNRNKFNESLVQSLTNPTLKARLFLSKASEELENDHPDIALEYLNKIPDLKVQDAYISSEFNKLKCDLFAVTGNTEALALEISKNPFPEQSLRAQYYKAIIYLDNGKDELASQIFENYALKDPFYEEFVIAASSFYNRMNLFEKGYNFLYKAIQQNKNSIRLNKAYIFYCGKWGSANFGKYQLMDFKKLVSEEEYKAVEARFLQLLYEWKTTDPFIDEETQ